MNLYHVLFPVRKEEKPRERWYWTKGDALRAYNHAVREVNDGPSDFSDTTIQIELIVTELTTAKLACAVLNDGDWRKSTDTLHFHRINEW